MGIKRVGDWATAQAFLTGAPAKVDAALNAAIRVEAEHFRAEVIKGFTSQAPGGQKFKPLSPWTIAKRKATGFRGRKALIHRGDLRRSIKVTKAPGGYFVGVLRSARSASGGSLVNVAATHEFGARVVIVWTPKMRRYLKMIARRYGGRKMRGGAISGGQADVTVAIIPPRPFLQPVADKLRPGSANRVVATFRTLMGKSFGKPGII